MEEVWVSGPVLASKSWQASLGKRALTARVDYAALPSEPDRNAAGILAVFQLPENESFFVMAGLVPAIHVLLRSYRRKDVDARHKAGHDEPMGSARFHSLRFESDPQV
jgi:hypothetical protein